MSEVKYFDGSNRRLNNLINWFKIWVVNKITEWWGTLTLTHADAIGNTWGYKVSLDNASGDLKNSPRLHIASNDWMYSDWVKSESYDNFCFTCAPSQGQNIKDGGKYINYYIESISVTPVSGDMLTLGKVYSDKFTVKGGTSTQAITSGGTMELSSMVIKTSVDVVNVMLCSEFSVRSTTNIAYKLSDYTFNRLKTTDFFQTMNEGLTFSMTNDTASGYPRFVTMYISSVDTINNMVCYVVKNNGSFTGCNYAICFTIPGDETSGNLNDFPSNVDIIDEFFEFDVIAS